MHRSILEWEHWGEPNVVIVFVTLLLLANSKRGWWHGIRCERGETLVTVETLKDITKLSKPTLIRVLRLLEDSGEITRKRIDQKHTKTTIKKYNEYQDINIFSGKATLPQTLPQTLPKQQRKQRKQYIGGDNISRAHTHEEIIADLLKSQSLIEAYCKNERITPEQFAQLAHEVSVEWSLTGETYPTDTDMKKRLLAHIRNKAQALKVQRESIEERKSKFLAECKELVAQGFNRNDVAEFARYYSQETSEGQLLFETYKGWDTQTRYLINKKRNEK